MMISGWVGGWVGNLFTSYLLWMNGSAEMGGRGGRGGWEDDIPAALASTFSGSLTSRVAKPTRLLLNVKFFWSART